MISAVANSPQSPHAIDGVTVTGSVDPTDPSEYQSVCIGPWSMTRSTSCSSSSASDYGRASL